MGNPWLPKEYDLKMRLYNQDVLVDPEGYEVSYAADRVNNKITWTFKFIVYAYTDNYEVYENDVLLCQDYFKPGGFNVVPGNALQITVPVTSWGV